MGIAVIPASGGLTASDLVGTPNWTLLGSNTTTSSSSSISVSGIPSTYRDLRIYIGHIRPVSDLQPVYLRLNNDSTSGVYSSFGGGHAESSPYVIFAAGHSNTLYNWTGSNSFDGAFMDFTIHNYTSTDPKLITGSFWNRSTQFDHRFHIRGLYKPTVGAAITSIDITNPAGNVMFNNIASRGLYVFGGK